MMYLVLFFMFTRGIWGSSVISIPCPARKEDVFLINHSGGYVSDDIQVCVAMSGSMECLGNLYFNTQYQLNDY